MLRLGTGAGFSSDRLGPAVDLAEKGELDWLVFETIGERTLAFGRRDRQLNPDRGYNPKLTARLRAVLPHCRDNGTRIMTNMGVANVEAAARVVTETARALGIRGLKVAAVTGDDVTKHINADTILFDHGNRRVGDFAYQLVGANAYLGTDALLPAIETGADVIITGRVADPSLFLAPVVAHYGWAMDNWSLLGKGTVVGHLMECGMQITGGYFADPGFKDVPRPADIGYPIAEVEENGDVTISKLPDSGGLVSPATVKEQLFYEVHDPGSYLTPDVTADFSSVTVRETAPNKVHVSNGSGRQRPDRLKVTVGFDGGFLGEGGISYAGINAASRARLARDVLVERLDRIDGIRGTYRIDLIGINAVHQTANPPEPSELLDVRVRVAMRSTDRELVDMALWELESLYCCGPAGGAGFRGQITPSIVTHSAMIDRHTVIPAVEVFES